MCSIWIRFSFWVYWTFILLQNAIPNPSQPHGQSSCFVALGTQLFVIRGEDLRQSALCSFPHRIIRFAIFERHSALIVHCENSLVFRVKADFSSKTRIELDNQAVLRDVAFDEEAEAMLMFFENNRVKLINL